MIFEAKDISGLPEMASAFLKAAGDRRVFAFHGSMGAGKTTLISEICRSLGVTDEETVSPTFSIVNEYTTADGESIFHFDFYRIESMEEALDLGLEEYFDSGCLCLMEWPEKVEALLPSETVDVYITELSDGSRRLEMR